MKIDEREKLIHDAQLDEILSITNPLEEFRNHSTFIIKFGEEYKDFNEILDNVIKERLYVSSYSYIEEAFMRAEEKRLSLDNNRKVYMCMCNSENEDYLKTFFIGSNLGVGNEFIKYPKLLYTTAKMSPKFIRKDYVPEELPIIIRNTKFGIERDAIYLVYQSVNFNGMLSDYYVLYVPDGILK